MDKEWKLVKENDKFEQELAEIHKEFESKDENQINGTEDEQQLKSLQDHIESNRELIEKRKKLKTQFDNVANLVQNINLISRNPNEEKRIYSFPKLNVSLKALK